MQRKRLTRAESREQTRQRLLDAAMTSIATKGLVATSVEDITAKAGYTRGAFYSNFSSKSELFIELLRLDHRHNQENLRKLLEASTHGENHQTRLASLYLNCYRDNNSYILWAEARLQAVRDAGFRQRMNIFCAERLDMVARFLELLCMPLGIQLPCSFTDHAFAIIALMDSAHQLNMTMPDEVPGALIEALLSIDRLNGPWASRKTHP